MQEVIKIDHPKFEARNMSVEPRVSVIESDKDVVVERKDGDDGLVEVGSVSETTKGTPLGNQIDGSGADFRLS